MQNKILNSYSIFRRELALLGNVELKKLKMSSKAIRILYRLSLSDASMSELALFDNGDKASITRSIATLEKSNLVKKYPDSNDGRISMVTLTKKGIEKAAIAQKYRSYLGQQINNTLTTSEREVLAELLHKVADGLKQKRGK